MGIRKNAQTDKSCQKGAAFRYFLADLGENDPKPLVELIRQTIYIWSFSISCNKMDFKKVYLAVPYISFETKKFHGGGGDAEEMWLLFQSVFF